MNYTKILKSSQLSLTQSRVSLLKVLGETKIPLSGKEIELKINGDCDRATIYRNIKTLSSKGILQRVLSGRSVKYKYNHSESSNISGRDHVHFQCKICQKLICLEEIIVSDFDLPEGFRKIENQFLIVGICKSCNRERENS